MVRAQLFSAAAVAAFCFGASSSPPTGLEPNNVEEPNEVRNASHVCDGRTRRSQECSVLLDVPIACAAPGKMSTPCPIVFFLHDAQQRDAAMAALAARPEAHTKLEVAPDFWDAEPYHQKWLLQRKRDLFLALGMRSEDELLGPLPSVLNAFAAGKLRADVAAERMARCGASEEMLAAVFGELQ